MTTSITAAVVVVVAVMVVMVLVVLVMVVAAAAVVVMVGTAEVVRMVVVVVIMVVGRFMVCTHMPGACHQAKVACVRLAPCQPCAAALGSGDCGRQPSSDPPYCAQP